MAEIPCEWIAPHHLQTDLEISGIDQDGNKISIMLKGARLP